MEPHLGHDFSSVRLHADPRAAVSAQAVNALAYTVGRDIAFAGGEYAPGTRSGQRLLAHELTHVVQQNANSQLQPKVIGREGDAFEQEAERVSSQIGQGGGASALTSAKSAGVLQRTPAHK